MKPRPLLIGLTGGIAAGKSAALAAFRDAGAKTLCLDEVAHRITAKGTPAYKAILKTFGRDILASNGDLDRAALGRLVFSDTRARRRLEGLTHPRILKYFRRRVASARRGVLIVDAPLLFEQGREREFDATLVVTASPKRRAARARRRGMAAADFRRRAAAQLPGAVKAARADVVIRNDGSLQDLRRTVKQYQQAFELMSGGK